MGYSPRGFRRPHRRCRGSSPADSAPRRTPQHPQPGRRLRSGRCRRAWWRAKSWNCHTPSRTAQLPSARIGIAASCQTKKRQWLIRFSSRFRAADDRYLVPTMMIVNEPGTVVPRPPRPVGGGAPAGGGGGGGPASDAIAKRCPVLLSKAIVRAPLPGHVFRFCSTSKLVGLFSLTLLIVPLPCVLNASIVCGLNAAPSELPAGGRRSRLLRSFALRMTNRCDGGRD